MKKARQRNLLVSLLVTTAAGAMATLALAEAPAGSWTVPFRLSAPPGPSIHAQVAADSTKGNLLVIWTEGGMGEEEEIVGRHLERSSGIWTSVQNLSQSEWEDRSPLLFFDSRGQGLVIWTRRYAAYQGAPADGTDLVWRAWGGSGWSAEQVLLHNDFFLPGTYGLIPVEVPDAILLFITWDNGYRVTEYRDGIWSELSPWEYLDYEEQGVTPVLAQIISDDEGTLHAAAFGENTSQQGADRYYYDAYYLKYVGAQWSTPLNISASDGVANSLGLAFDGQGRLHFLWSDPHYPFSYESARSAIWERVYDGGVWSTANTQVTAYNPDQAISDFSLTADASGILHLAWSEGIMVAGGHSDLDVYYQTGNGTTWGPEEKVYTSTVRSTFPSLVVTDNGAALAWQEGPVSDGEVYFSQRNGMPSQTYWIYLPTVWR